MFLIVGSHNGLDIYVLVLHFGVVGCKLEAVFFKQKLIARCSRISIENSISHSLEDNSTKLFDPKKSVLVC